MAFSLKKTTSILLVAALTLVVACFVFYRFYLHSMIAETIQSDPDNSIFIPDTIKPTIVKARQKLDQEINDIPYILDTLNLDFDDILFIVDNVNSDQVIAAINELDRSEIKSEDQVFNILKKNIAIEGYDLEIFRSTFKKKTTLNKIKRGLQIIKDRQLTTSVSIPVARRTVKQILLGNRPKIEATLQSL